MISTVAKGSKRLWDVTTKVRQSHRAASSSSSSGFSSRDSRDQHRQDTDKSQTSAIAKRDTFASQQQQQAALSQETVVNRSRLAIEAAARRYGASNYAPHPTGIVLRRVGYYTIPSLDDLKSYLAEDGSCVVPNFTIGREGYGTVFFAMEMDVAGLNLDEIVYFRNKGIIIYPDDEKRPPINQGLKALEQVWPVDKTQPVPVVKDAQRLIEMNWEGHLRCACYANDTRFVEYRPETGSWVFCVKHFSKYGLDEDDDKMTLHSLRPSVKQEPLNLDVDVDMRVLPYLRNVVCHKRSHDAPMPRVEPEVNDPLEF
ncbi:nuclear pore complex protein Nup98-Nup96-like [Drosophila obscura]|uniref:nuclear pore complex protein Nup98-Nup96-like n=1 Tax=Drosophila obscura TaxID=7282 RepID=UPI001BB2AEAA|nr:nuclear pore complex protein Nup98-Nup96-like [Drosophila obscura]